MMKMFLLLPCKGHLSKGFIYHVVILVFLGIFCYCVIKSMFRVYGIIYNHIDIPDGSKYGYEFLKSGCFRLIKKIIVRYSNVYLYAYYGNIY